MLLWQTRMTWTTWLLMATGAGICFAQDAPRSVSALADNDSHRNAQPSFVVPPTAAFPSTSVPIVSDPLVIKTDANGKRTIRVQYVVMRPVFEHSVIKGTDHKVTRYVTETKVAVIDVDQDLDKLDLPPDVKRAAVLAVTAARHDDLLKQLREAKSEEDKKKAVDALKANYAEHYAIETWWREQRLGELELRLTKLRAQVKTRQDAEEKYVEAVMTIAQLWADGIAITPPRPGSTPETLPAAPRAAGVPSLSPLRLEPQPARFPTLPYSTLPSPVPAPARRALPAKGKSDR